MSNLRRPAPLLLVPLPESPAVVVAAAVAACYLPVSGICVGDTRRPRRKMGRAGCLATAWGTVLATQAEEYGALRRAADSSA